MTKTFQSLRDSKKARWTALIVASFAMFGAYYFNYALSPLKPMLESILGWNSTDFGTFNSSYAVLNVFLFMLVFSGIILDKMGIRFTGIMATILMVIGTGVNYFALITEFPAGAEFAGIKMQVLVAAAGFGIFGVGTEAAGITVSKAVVKWFKGKELALAMGMQMSIARLGTALALGIALPVANKYNYASPVLLAFVFMLIALAAFIVYSFMDKKLDQSLADQKEYNKKHNIGGDEEEELFELKDILEIITNRGFWYIALLCVLFYSAVFPFLYYATDLMINKYNVNPNLAGSIPALLPFGTIFLTPLFGSIYDKKGKGATIMIIGALILIVVHGTLTIPGLDSWILATLMVILLGIGFSLVPAAMWPSVPKIIPEKQLGTAYAVIFWIQNIGLWGIPLLLGIILNVTNPSVSPNKKFIKQTIKQAYTIELKDHDLKFTEDEITKFAEQTSTKLINTVVYKTSYKPADDDKVDTESIKKGIAQVVRKTNLDLINSKDRNDFEEKLVAATSKGVVPHIVKAKLNIRYDYFWDMLLFTILGILSLVIGFLLKREDKLKGYGLEKPNIRAEVDEEDLDGSAYYDEDESEDESGDEEDSESESSETEKDSGDKSTSEEDSEEKDSESKDEEDKSEEDEEPQEDEEPKDESEEKDEEPQEKGDKEKLDDKKDEKDDKKE
ncbi:MAG: MFS transporter [Deltaproteobacteria bacterium]|jgi:nitrate/nitrite transporter NarK|nr:MFS transporter [Deltaproteobacteria bacterium]